MKSHLILVSLLCLLTACGGPESDSTQVTEPAATQSEPASPNSASSLPPAAAQAVSEYESQAKAFVEQIDAGADAATLTPLAQNLLDLSVEIEKAYVPLKPECADYLAAASRIVELWPTLSLETIENDYHHDGALPKSESTAVCYHMKDLIVHPATALALLAEDVPDRVKIRDEIQEVIAHASVVHLQP